MLTNSPDKTAPNFALDPQGLRGTASARRRQQSQRRKKWETFLVALLLMIGATILVWFSLQPRATGFAVASAQTVPLDLCSPAALDKKGDLIMTSASGALWQINANGQSHSLAVASRAGAPPLVAENRFYVPGLDGVLTALDESGKTLWQRDVGGALATTPALWQAKILAVGDGDGRVLSLDANDGKTQWKIYLGGAIGDAIIATHDGFLAPTLANGVWRGGLVCLDAQNGQIKWRFPAENRNAAGIAPPLFDAANERVYWNNDEGEIVCLDAKTGRTLWHHQIAPDATSSVILRAAPVLVGQSLFVGGGDGLLRSFNASDGKAHSTIPLGAPIHALFAVRVGANPALLAATEREVVLIDAATGALIQRDTGAMAWPTRDSNGAIVVGANGSWRRVRW